MAATSMAPTRALMAWLLALVVLHTPGTTTAVRITELTVPQVALEGDDIHLRCDFDDGGSLYSFKWYKDDQEIYRHLPGRTHSAADRCFEEERLDVQVDCWSSTDRDVILTSVTPKSSGDYKCEVISDSPTFTKKYMTATLNVYSEPLQRPLVVGVEDSYSPLQQVALNCSSLNTEYQPNISWMVNGQPADPRYLQHYEDRRTLGLVFSARPHLFQRGLISATCVLALGKEHWQQHLVQLTNRDYLTAQGFQYNGGPAIEPRLGRPLALALLLTWLPLALLTLH